LPDHPARIVRLPYRVLFFCTGNSARSQIAEAVLGHRGRGRFVAESAGSRPAEQVHPLAIEALETIGIRWGGRAPRALDAGRSLPGGRRLGCPRRGGVTKCPGGVA